MADQAYPEAMEGFYVARAKSGFKRGTPGLESSANWSR
jgi:hypothetical protein